MAIAALSERAGVAVGTVYRTFGDKEGLLRRLEEEFTAETMDEIRQRMRCRAISAEADPSHGVAVRAIGGPWIPSARYSERLRLCNAWALAL